MRHILKRVSEASGIPIRDLRGMYRDKRICLYREIFYYLARSLAARTYPEIGRFIRRDHTSVMSGAKKIAALRLREKELCHVLADLETELALLLSYPPYPQLRCCASCPLLSGFK